MWCHLSATLLETHRDVYIYMYTRRVYKTQSSISHYQTKCYMMAVLWQRYLPQRLLQIYIQICHLIFLCCCCNSLINNLISQASWMWQHFCHIVIYFLCRATWDSSPRMWLWWHTIILPVNPIRMPDLLECQRARSPWNHRRLKRHYAELCGMQRVHRRVLLCVHGFTTVCIKPLAHARLRMGLYSCVGVHFSVVATVHLH